MYIPTINKIFEKKINEIKPESNFRMLNQELLIFMFSSSEDFSKILTHSSCEGKKKKG